MLTLIEAEETTLIGANEKVKDWVKDNLILMNPEFTKKVRMGFYTGKTPMKLELYRTDGEKIIVPYGAGKMLQEEKLDLSIPVPLYAQHSVMNYHMKDVGLYDYQKDAVEAMIETGYGILQSPAGSGKTQMAIAYIQATGYRTLWLTHTKDLLIQSMDRAKQYIYEQFLGTITEGEVHIGRGITFATVQTMSRLDLTKYRDTWDCVIVDECHRVAGTPSSMTMFSKVLNSLNAEHKIGLSATVHRADGLIQATYALLGPIVHSVPAEAVANKVMTVTIQPVQTDVPLDERSLNTDGTLNYAKMLTTLGEDEYRNALIATYVQPQYSTLILSDRLSQLKSILDCLPDKDNAVLIDGKTKKDVREKALQDMRDGKKKVLLATYSLAKEGLDVPRLNRLMLASPQKDYAIVTQSIGRIARTFEGKTDAIAYDFIDDNRYLRNSFKTRCRTYRKLGCVINDE